MPRSSRKAAAASAYDVHPGVAMMAKWRADLPKKTGKSLEEWVALVKKEGPATLKERRAWLKEAHQLGTNTAWQIADCAEEKGWMDGDPVAYLKAAAEHVEGMFAGPKAELRPIFEAIVLLARQLGADVKVCPCQTIVPLYRQHVCAQIKPTTRTRIDLGYALGDTEATGRLIDTGGFAKKDRITHRIPLTNVKEIDAEVKRWLKKAYEGDA